MPADVRQELNNYKNNPNSESARNAVFTKLYANNKSVATNIASQHTGDYTGLSNAINNAYPSVDVAEMLNAINGLNPDERETKLASIGITGNKAGQTGINTSSNGSTSSGGTVTTIPSMNASMPGSNTSSSLSLLQRK